VAVQNSPTVNEEASTNSRYKSQSLSRLSIAQRQHQASKYLRAIGILASVASASPFALALSAKALQLEELAVGQLESACYACPWMKAQLLRLKISWYKKPKEDFAVGLNG
jgi:hypothetical protein